MCIAKFRFLLVSLLFSTLFLSLIRGNAQPYTSIELNKPAKYENTALGAEKTGSKKLSGGKKIYQNTVSHYNYYFNAQYKINEILEKAKASFREDYTVLLPFYNYTMNAVAGNRVQLDSVLYKCTAGILLHDLRTDWVDDLYLLMGQAYLYKKDYDSAARVFQYINYAFAPKDGGYDIPIGSNASNNKGEFTVSTKESRSLWKKITSTPPGRNESFLWRIRTYLEQDQLADAGALIQILQIDPNFPDRLKSHLHELTAYKFYKENNADSAAWHLNKALGRATNNSEKSRWQFLIGQLYSSTHNDSLAVLSYRQALKSTLDPTMEVYAHLAISALESSHKPDAIQQNLNELIKMGKRPLYESYRDIIYYAAAKLELQQHHPDIAQGYLLKSIKYNQNNLSQRQESFLLLADLNYSRKSYSDAYRFYDSLQVDVLKEYDQKRVTDRKPALKKITENLEIIRLEDSLQKLALMPVDERNLFLKNKLKQLRKEAGLKELENQEPSFGTGFLTNQGQGGSDFFNTTNTEFYFQNNSLKTKGFSEFKTKWGNRPNVDNWRRQAALEKSFAKTNPTTKTITQSPDNPSIQTPVVKELTLESLKENLPLTTEKMSASYLKVLNALLSNGTVFQNELEDYETAIQTYRTIVTRFPDITETEKSLYNLAICYDKNNQPIQADSVRNALRTNFSGGNFSKSLQQQGKADKKDPATETYSHIYDLFIAGNFKEALDQKQIADKKYGSSHWTPQQMYIESIYYVRNNQDSFAITRLNEVMRRSDKNAPLAEKAATMIDVLKRRKEIETYLTNLKIEKPEEEANRQIDLDTLTTVKNVIPFKAETTIKQTPKELKVADKIAPVSKPVIISNSGYSFNPSDPQYVALILVKVDGIFASEGKNAFNRYNRENYSTQAISMNSLAITGQEQLILMGPFANAGDAVGYLNKTKPFAASRIIPWLAADKYSFTIISSANLEILKTTKDLAAYKNFMHGIFPDNF